MKLYCKGSQNSFSQPSILNAQTLFTARGSSLQPCLSAIKMIVSSRSFFLFVWLLKAAWSVNFITDNDGRTGVQIAPEERTEQTKPSWKEFMRQKTKKRTKFESTRYLYHSSKSSKKSAIREKRSKSNKKSNSSKETEDDDTSPTKTDEPSKGFGKGGRLFEKSKAKANHLDCEHDKKVSKNGSSKRGKGKSDKRQKKSKKSIKSERSSESNNLCGNEYERGLTSSPSLSNQPSISSSPSLPPSTMPSEKPSGRPSISQSPTVLRCVVRANTQFCDDQVAKIDYDPECVCYNFCDGAYVGCCAEAAECDITCVGFLIAGCEHPDEPTDEPTEKPSESPSSFPSESAQPSHKPSSQPSNSPTVSLLPSRSVEPSEIPSLSALPSHTPTDFPSSEPSLSGIPSSSPSSMPSFSPSISTKPSSSPSGSPTMGHEPSANPSVVSVPSDGICLIEVNKALCEETMVGQEPIDGCDCYNYCDGTYNGCCGYNQGKECDQECFGTVVAGCVLPPPTSSPSQFPTKVASSSPSSQPSLIPSQLQTNLQSLSSNPSRVPSNVPNQDASISPSLLPSPNPSSSPTTSSPSYSPTKVASSAPSSKPSLTASQLPTNLQGLSSNAPTQDADISPSLLPSSSPTSSQ